MKLFKKTEDELIAPLKKGDDKIKIPFIFVCLTQIRNKKSNWNQSTCPMLCIGIFDDLTILVSLLSDEPGFRVP